jgi:hypothetical protein
VLHKHIDVVRAPGLLPLVSCHRQYACRSRADMASPRGGGSGGVAEAAAAHAERSDRLSRNLLANLRTLNESLASVRTSVAKIDALAQQRLCTTAGNAPAAVAVVARKPSTKGGSAVKGGASAATTLSLPSALARTRSPSAASRTSRASAKSSASSRAGTPPPVGWSHHDASADAEVSAANEAWRRATTTGAASPATGLAAAFGGSRGSIGSGGGGGGVSPSHSRHSSRHSRGGHSVHFHAAADGSADAAGSGTDDDDANAGGTGVGSMLIAPAAGSASPASVPVELQQQLRRSALRHSAVSAGTSGSEDERGAARLRFGAAATAVSASGGRHRGRSAGDDDGDDDADGSSGGEDDDGIEFDRQSERSSVRFRLPPTGGGGGGDDDDDDASNSGDSDGGGGDGSASARRRRVHMRPPPPVLRGSSGGSAPDSARYDAATVSSGGYADSVAGDDDDDDEEDGAAGAGGWAGFPRGSPGAGSSGGAGSARKDSDGRSLGAQGKRRRGGSVRFAAAGGGGSADSSMALDDDVPAGATASAAAAGDIDAYEGDVSGLDADLEALLLRQQEEEAYGARGLSTASTAGSGSAASGSSVLAPPAFLVPSLEVAAAAVQMDTARALDGAQARHRAFQALLAVHEGRSPASPPLARQTSPSHLADGGVAAMVPAREAAPSAFGVSTAPTAAAAAAAGTGSGVAARRRPTAAASAAGGPAASDLDAADVRVAPTLARASAAGASQQLQQQRVFRFKRYAPPAGIVIDDDGTADDIPLSVSFVSEEAFRAAETEAEQMAQLRQRVASLSTGGGGTPSAGSGTASSLSASGSSSAGGDPYVLTGADAEDPTDDVDALAAAIAGWHGGDVPWETTSSSSGAAAAGADDDGDDAGAAPARIGGGGGGGGGGPRFEALSLRVVYRAGRTGFEETKDWVPAPGEVVAGRYRVREPLGSAAFSSAVSATDLVTGCDVCLKIIKSNMDYFIQSIDEIKLLRYVNAAVAGGDPDAAGVLRLHDYFYHREHLLLVTELLKDNLYEFQRYLALQGAAPYFTGARLRSIARQVLTSLAAIHGAGLIHCDREWGPGEVWGGACCRGG